MSDSSIVWGLVFGSIGLGYFMYGKKQSNVVARLSGIGLMIYPYFVSSALLLIVIGLVLMALPKFIEL